jgi:phosphoribulokinase
VIVQVLPTQLIPDDNEGKVLRVRLIQKEGVKHFEPTYLFDEGSTISWIPCGRKLTCSYPGIKFFYGPDTYYGDEVSVLEMDGQFDKLEVHTLPRIPMLAFTSSFSQAPLSDIGPWASCTW